MFKKVLVAEDYDGMNLALKQVLKDMDIQDIHGVGYCDEALLKIKEAHQNEKPYDLLITDLSFERDHKVVKLGSGQELIAAARHIQPSLNVLVFSVENKPHPIQHLFRELEIDGYVLKGRHNIPELKKAIAAVHSGNHYISPELSQVLTDKSLDEIEDYDRKLLHLLAQGTSQADIAEAFQKKNWSPNSVSSIEKRINRLKIMLKANNNVQLIAIAKDLGLV
ncbi:response regulator transcription factor [Flavobacterium sp. MAH-1]|uniref:Response regulator transcription factor n=1 Tax=Flavobacterium agri TaxID=2743471 RepID=A0A7Y8XZG8_9FLAO|nr:response regulator [Flavobacterium agri]NUY79673.1 response regulator transcription factor [Flavobacterium agri]NYA69698.1 response regulator transcription factor [Flavobacterium agri]